MQRYLPCWHRLLKLVNPMAIEHRTNPMSGAIPDVHEPRLLRFVENELVNSSTTSSDVHAAAAATAPKATTIRCRILGVNIVLKRL